MSPDGGFRQKAVVRHDSGADTEKNQKKGKEVVGGTRKEDGHPTRSPRQPPASQH